MTNEPLHPLPPDVWSDPPQAAFEMQMEPREAVTTIQPTCEPLQ